MKSIYKKLVIVLAFPVLAFLFAGLYVWIEESPNYREALNQKRKTVSQMVVDRNGAILRMDPDEHGEFFIWLKHDQIPQLMKNAVIAAEDKRFYRHTGFDLLATIRACYSYYTSGKVVSGASTISQQVVRMLNPRPRTLRSKLIEFLAALKLEWQLSKEEILELNLNLAPMGGYLKGVGLASLVYFDKKLNMISLSEAAALAALPRSPSRFDPSKPTGKALLLEEKDRIIARMLNCGFISADEAEKSIGQNLVFRRRRIPRQASHFTEQALERRRSSSSVLNTTLDLDTQKIIEESLLAHKSRLALHGIKQAAVIVVRVKDLAVVALAGSMSYGPLNGGFNNGAMARRSAGSTLKPFLYALALERGMSSQSTIPDLAQSFKTPTGDYIPLNANRTEYGPVSVPEALGSSLNLSAVKAIERTGVTDFLDLLKKLGVVDRKNRNAEHYGYGLAIGNMEVNLFELAQAYACLARKGVYGDLRLTADEPITSRRILSESSVTEITEILSNHSYRIPGFGNPHFFDVGFPLALKTGTSDGFRDAWTIAYTSEHVIGIWAGNFDGKPFSGMSGASSCGPILKDIVSNLGIFGVLPDVRLNHENLVLRQSFNADHHVYLGAEYAGWIHKRQLNLGTGRYRLDPFSFSGSSAYDLSGADPPTVAPPHTLHEKAKITIKSPHDGDRFVKLNRSGVLIPLRAAPSQVVHEVTWIIDGVEVARTKAPYELLWEASSGAHSILAVMPGYQAAKIEITVE